MASTSAIQTVLCWSTQGEISTVEFWRNEDYYVFSATPDTLRQMLRLVGVCAGDPKLNLTWDDAAQITATLRVFVTEVEPTVHVTSYEQAVDAVVESCDVRWLGWVLAASGVFWLCVGWWVVKALN